MLKCPFERRERCSIEANLDPGVVEAAVRIGGRSKVALKFAEVVVDGEFAEAVVNQVLLLFVSHCSLIDANFFGKLVDLG